MVTASIVYFAGALVTGGLIGAANRVTGINKVYTFTAAAVWPAWWTRYALTDSH